MVSRGTIVLDSGSQTLNLNKEMINLRTGVVNKNLPALSSSSAWQAAIFGRGREIVVEGWYSGDQIQIETFIDFFEKWLNKTLSFQETAKYYPLFHPDNQVNGSQGNYWNVLGVDFQWEYDRENPRSITYTLTMNEGTKAGAFSTE